MTVQVAVVGAGTVGLLTATCLQESVPSAKVTVVADKFLEDTVSYVAAGIFRAGRSFSGPSPEVTRQWLTDSWQFYQGILKKDVKAANEAGIKEIGLYIYSHYPKNTQNEFLQMMSEEARLCKEEEMRQVEGNFKYGSYFKTMLIESRYYLPFLMEKFKKQGGVFVTRRIESFEDLAGKYDVVCNCTGLGARELCNDGKLTPLRGQVFKVKAPWIKDAFYHDFNTYILPGKEFVTVGGVRQFDSFEAEIDKHDSASIWERCTNFLPSLRHSEIVAEVVGFRPHRSEVRVESEVFSYPNGKRVKVVHNYGHGGYGILSAPGTSMHAVRLVKEFLQRSKL